MNSLMICSEIHLLQASAGLTNKKNEVK